MSQASYRKLLREPVRGLWSGVLDIAQFELSLEGAIVAGLNQAWNEGAATVGLLPSDRTVADEINLQSAIARESSYISRLGAFVQEHRRELQEPGAIRQSLMTVYNRLELWVNRWLDLFNKGVMSGQIDPKLKWLYDHGKEHCATCLKLHNKIKRKSVWAAAGLEPQSTALA